MPTRKPRKPAEPTRADDRTVVSERDESRDERLRLVGDGNFVDVAWSGRDNPSWPLPRK